MNAIRYATAASVIAALAVVAVGDTGSIREYPHVTADRAANRVVIEAQSTELGPDEPVEFVLINSRSGHDYEALAVTKATAADIRAAMEFIDLAPGRPVDHDGMQFWPRGDSIQISIEWTVADEGGERVQKMRLDEFLIDTRNEGQKLSPEPFMFTGSLLLPGEDEGEKILYSDLREPHSIISTYNESNSIIDVGRQAGQGGEYGKILVNPEKVLPPKSAVKIHIQPAAGDLAREEVDLVLTVAADPDSETILRFSLICQDGEALLADGTLTAVMARFQKLREQNNVPHVKLDFGSDITADRITSVCVLLSQIDNVNGIRIGAPSAGQLYYRAFLPDPVIFDRDVRGLQPVELHLFGLEGELSAKVVKAERIWEDDELDDGRLELNEYSVDGVEAARDKMLELRNRIPVLLVHVENDIQFGDIMSYVHPVLDEFPTVFILIEGND